MISSLSKFAAVFLFYLMPDNPTYWAWVFPAMLAECTCTDVLWTVSNVFLTTSLPKQRQGLAGALINISLFLGCAFFLAIADVSIGKFEEAGWDLKKQYKMVFLIGSIIASIACLICLTMDIKAATSQPSEEENTVGPVGSEVACNRAEQEMGCVAIQTNKIDSGSVTDIGEASSYNRANKGKSKVSAEELHEDPDSTATNNSSNSSEDEWDNKTVIDDLNQVQHMV